MTGAVRDDGSVPRTEGPGDDAGRAGGAELLPVASGGRVRALLGELVRPHRGLAAAGAVVMAAATAVGMLTPPLLGRVVDLVARHRPPDAVTPVIALLAAVAVVQGLATAWGLTLVARLGETVLARLRERFVERALHLPLAQVERSGSGDMVARATGDVSLVAEAVRKALPELVRSVPAILLTLAGLAVLDWRFFVAALLAAPVQAYTARWYVRRAVPLYAEQRVANGAQQQQLLEGIGGAATVRALRLEDEHAGLVARRSSAVVDLTMRGVTLVLRFYMRLHVAEYTGLAAVLVAGFLLVRGGSVSVGTATAAALYFHNLFTPMNTALALLDDAQAAAAGLARLTGVADRPAPRPSGRLRPRDASVPTRELARRLGILPQSPVAPEGITVADLVGRGRSPHQTWWRQWSRGDERAVADALDATGMRDLADRPVGELSGGQRQRAWIAMAVAQETPLLLLDEPTTYLDLAHQIDVLDLVADLNRREGRTVVMVLHDLNHACRYADHIVAMKDGRVAAMGAPSAIVNEDPVEEVFRLRCQVGVDPVAGTPLIIPIGRHRPDAPPAA
ncbi:ABC transporter transmembrane domain-containing protein [Spirillospora sp. CA-108201]